MNKHYKVFDQFEQNTPPWEFVRLGIITASEFALVNRRGVGGKGPSLTRERRVNGCAFELMTGVRPDTWQGNKYTERGNAQEAEALELYCDIRLEGQAVERPAFIRRDDLQAGASPDALVGEDGGVEIKTMSGDSFVKLLRNPGVPPEHVPQLQGSLLITGRKWWDLVVYSPPLAPYIVRVLPDLEYQRELREGIKTFNAEVESVVMQLQGETIKTCRARLDARLEEVIEEWGKSEPPAGEADPDG